MCFELIHVLEYAPDKLLRGVEIFQGDVVRNSIEIGQCGIRPNYFSHRAILALACSLETVRPSSTARSPRAMPSSNFTLA